jgi:flagellar export protein FliJ
MKRFVFRLERLLELRIAAERAQAAELGLVRRAEEECRRLLLEAERRLEAAVAQLAGTPAELRTAGTMQNLEWTRDRVASEVDDADTKHRAAMEKVEAARVRYDEARVARRAIERLREQRHEAWVLDTSRREQRDLDEIALRMKALGASAP